MKSIKPISQMIQTFSLFVVCCMLLQQSMAQPVEETEFEDKTKSPYFFVMSKDTSVDQLPLKKTSANVTISGVIADVSVRQMYCNEGDSVLEAIYIFPASTKAAVYAMEMTVGNRLLKAKIKEREQAREEYEQAKEDGKTVTLLEQHRPNVFQMNVANILPGDTIMVDMHYTELITPVDGIYEFVYPTVVGPRYGSPKEDQDGIEWIETPYTHEGEPPTYKFNINVQINAGMHINDVLSPSHDVDISSVAEDNVVCGLPESEAYSGNKDFILRYRLTGDAIASGLLLFEGEDENFFLAMVQPPAQPLSSDIPPREYVFIMDVSGSMNGFPIDISKTLLKDIVENLSPNDKFNLLFFAGGNYLLSESSLDANQENIDRAIDAIEDKVGGGGTELLPALTRALNLPGTEDYSRIFVIATDGYVSAEKEAFDLIRTKLSEANFFPFGIGTGVNRHLIEGMAHAGMGEPMVATDQEEAETMAEKFRNYIASPVLTNIDLQINGFDVYDVEPMTVPDVFAERPVLIFGKYRGDASGSISVSGLNGFSEFNQTLHVSDYTADNGNAALRYLWARYRIQLLDDYGRVVYDTTERANIKKEVTDLGLRYNLLTQYTSFIAVDSIIRNDTAGITTVEQPLPLPEGVSDLAVGDAVSGRNGYGALSGSFIKADAEINSTEINRVYPNPFTNTLKVMVQILLVDFEKEKSIEIYNSQGDLVYVHDFSQLGTGIHEIELNLRKHRNLRPGVYFVQVNIGNKLVKKAKVIKLNH